METSLRDMCRRWSASTFRWLEFDFPISFSLFRWPEFDFSYFTTGWSFRSFWWLDFSILDSVLWTFVYAMESLALVAMLCFFFVFCGCTIWKLLNRNQLICENQQKSESSVAGNSGLTGESQIRRLGSPSNSFILLCLSDLKSLIVVYAGTVNS